MNIRNYCHGKKGQIVCRLNLRKSESVDLVRKEAGMTIGTSLNNLNNHYCLNIEIL